MKVQKSWHKLLALVLALAMVLPMLPVVQASAAETQASLPAMVKTMTWDFENSLERNDLSLYQSATSRFNLTGGALVSDGLDGELKAIVNNTPDAIRSVSVNIIPGASGNINAGLYVGASGASNAANGIVSHVFQIQSNFTGWNDAPNRIDIIHGQFNNNWKELGRTISESGRGNALFTKGNKEPLNLKLTFSEDVLLLTLSLVSNPNKFIHVMYEMDTSALVGQIGLRANGSDVSFDQLTVEYDQPLTEYQKLWDFADASDAEDFTLYTNGTSRFSVSDGMLKPNGGNGEMKAIFNEDMANMASISVDIIPGASGLMNGGIYVGAKNVSAEQDKADAIGVMIESMFSGWADAPNRVDLWLGKFAQGWGGEVANSRLVAETGNNNALYTGGVKKPLNLKLEFGTDSMTATLSLVENPNRYVQKTWAMTADQLTGQIGMRSQFIDLCYDNLLVTYKTPVEQSEVEQETAYENQGYNFFTSDSQAWEMKQGIATPYTLEAWVKVPQGIHDSATGYIVGNSYRSPYVSLEMITGGKLRLAWSVENADLTTAVKYYDVNTDIRNGKWTHVAYTCDVANDTVTAYINGSAAQTWTNAGLQEINLPDHVSPANGFIVGSQKDAEGDIYGRFPGWIADVRLWDNVLSADAIQTSMLSQYTTCEGLLFNAPLEEDFADVSGNGNDLQPNVAGLVLESQTHEPGSYSMVVIPDPQILNHYNPDLMLQMYQWIADNRETENIQMVMCVGDMIDNCGNITQWETAKAAWELLPSDLPFIVSPGNHDYDTNSGWDKGYGVREQLTLMNQYFPRSIYENYPTEIGFFDEVNSVNQWQAFCVNGNNYLVIALEYVPQDDVIAWANQVVEAHPNHQVIMVTHSYLGSYGNVTRTKLWNNFLSRHENIIMDFSGHVSHTDLVHRTDKGVNGNDVHQVLIDAQLEDVSGQYGMVGILRFNADGTVCDVSYYSTLKDQYEARSNFTLNLPAQERTYVAQVDGHSYYSLAEAVVNAEGSIVKLLADSQETITISCRAMIDLAGHNMENITVTGEPLEIIDSVGGGAATVSGKVETFCEADGVSYLVVGENGVYSAHSYQVKITHISLKPGDDALGYKAELVGDEAVQNAATAIGFNLWINENDVKTYTVSGKQNVTLRLKNILKNHGGEMDIHATAFVTLVDKTITGTQQTVTMKETLQLVNGAWSAYNKAQKGAVKALCDKYYDTVSGWGLDNIYPISGDGSVKESYEAITGSVAVNTISGYTVDGKLTAPNNGEGKVIWNTTPAGNKTVSVEIYPDANGINGGIYLGASGAGAARDAINAVYIGIEANHSGWADAVNRVDLIVGQFPWVEYGRVISETGRGNALYAGSREPLLLTATVDGNTITATVSLLSDPSKSVSYTYTYAGDFDLANGQVGLRSQFSSCAFDNFKVSDVTYTFDNEASTAGLSFYHSACANGVQATANNTLALHASATFTEGTLSATVNTAGKNGAGIVFGADAEGKNYYLFRMTNNQWVELVKVENGAETVVDRGFLSAGHDYNADHRLQIVKSGNTVYCYYYNRFEKINCYAVEDVTFAGDGMGLWAQTAGTAFREVTIEKSAQKRTADTLIFGHSYTEMWWDYETYFPEYTSIDDIGIGGSVAAHWEALTDEVISYEPKLGIYNIGINDLTGGTTPKAVVESMEKALLTIKEALPEFEVVLVSVSHCPARSTITDAISQTNALMRNLAASYDWMSYAEAEYLFCTDPSDPLSTNASLFIDGLHPSAQGYEMMAEVIRSAIRGENQPEFDETLAQSQIQALKNNKLATMELYGQNAYNASNWELAKPYYEAAVAKINACTTEQQLKDLNLSAELEQLREIPNKAVDLIENMADASSRVALAADSWTKANDYAIRVNGYSYALDNTTQYGDSQMVFRLTNNTGDVATGGVFLRATAKANKGIEGYLINYVTSGNYLQVYYVNNVYNTDGSSYVLTYLGGIVYGAYGNLVDTTFYAKIEGDKLYLNTLERQEAGQDALTVVDLTYGGEYEVFQSGYTGVLSWNNGVTFDMEIANYAATEVEDNTLRVLAIGNSFSIDGMEYVYQIARDLGVEEIELGNLYIGGCTLDTHYNNLQSGNGAYTYYYNKNGIWQSMANCSLAAAVTSEKWDIITFQQASGFSGMADSYAVLPDLIAGVKVMCPDAKLGWHMTWAYQGDSNHADFTKYNNDQMTMYNAIVAAVDSEILTNADIDFVIPAGTAIQNARTSYLGDTLTRDGYHLSYDIGRYIAGITWVEAITGLDASNLNYCPAGITEDVRRICVESAKNAAAAPYAVTNSQYNLEDNFLQLDLKLTSGWYSSTNTSGDPYKIYASTDSLAFYYTKVFAKAELPVGSIIVYTGNKTYRPEGWVNGAGTVRPDVTSKNLVVITEDWWGDYTERAFNIGVDSLAVTADQAAESFKIYVPLSAYEKVELTVEKAFYNSYLYPASQTQAADAGLKFFTVQTFTEDTLPVGSIILNTEGRNIRLERWIDGTVKNSDGKRGANSTATQHQVDESWWDGFDTRAFNIPVSSLDDSAVDALLEAFIIYVPRN